MTNKKASEAARLLGKASAEARKDKTDYRELGKKSAKARKTNYSELGKKGAAKRWKAKND